MSVLQQVITDKISGTPNSGILKTHANEGRLVIFSSSQIGRNKAAFGAPVCELTTNPVFPTNSNSIVHVIPKGILGDYHSSRQISILRKGRIKIRISTHANVPDIVDAHIGTKCFAMADGTATPTIPRSSDYLSGSISANDIIVATAAISGESGSSEGSVFQYTGTAWTDRGDLVDIDGTNIPGTITDITVGASVTGNGDNNDVHVFSEPSGGADDSSTSNASKGSVWTSDGTAWTHRGNLTDISGISTLGDISSGTSLPSGSAGYDESDIDTGFGEIVDYDDEYLTVDINFPKK